MYVHSFIFFDKNNINTYTILPLQPVVRTHVSMSEQITSFKTHRPAHLPPDIDEHSVELARQFYHRYKSACHGMTRREEVRRLFEDTYNSWATGVKDNYTFSKVLYAMTRRLNVCRVVNKNTIEWTVFDKNKELWKQKHTTHPSEPSVRRLQDMVEAQAKIVEQLITKLYERS